MKLIKTIMTKNPCYTAGRKITVKGLMLHSVGCPQPSASVFVNNWNKASFDDACVHAFIDGNTGGVYQTLPWDYRGWHGGGSCNDTHIGVEMCEPATIKYTGGSSWQETGDGTNTKATVLRTYKAAVELFAMLCKQYDLDPMADGVIVSHKEGRARGIASNHGDPDHIWKKFGLTMTQFRKDVKAAMSGTEAKDKNESSGTGSTSAALAFKVGDVVQFTGKKHFANANAATGPACNPGKAKVTAISKSGKHPYHLIAVSGSGSNVYGWVDADNVKALTAASSSGDTDPAKYRDAALEGTYKTTAALNMRTGAGTGKKIKLTIPKGGAVQCYGYYNKDNTGTKWLYVMYNGKSGYCSSKYLRK